MKIIRLKTNRMTNPLGFTLDKPRFSYVVTDTMAKKQTAARYEVALDEAFSNVIYDSGKREDIDSLAFKLPTELQPRTRYYWRVEVWADNDDHAVSDAAWFETAKLDEPWNGVWIVPELDKDTHPLLGRTFEITGEVASARAYVCGLGLYEMQVNGSKAGEEYFAPHFNAYQKWLQYQTYDVTEMLRNGENQVSISLGNGLYKGRFGFDGHAAELYGSEFALLCDIVVTYIDGSTAVICSDCSWTATKSKVMSGNLYDGEVYDATFESSETFAVREGDLGYERLKARLSLPVVIKKERKPIEVIHTPAGETVLDMGQNMVGWLRFRTDAPKGTVIRLQHGEVLQDGNFYRENLRTAKAEFQYIADGQEAVVRPYFTFYGFRYVKVEGWPGELSIDDFTGCVIYSDLEEIGTIETSDPLVNRLFQNALWGQRGNFLDLPTDCNQRDEKMGWTGDAQVFSGTACFNMDSYAFYRKYGYDMGKEQEDRGGWVPSVVPAVNVNTGGSSAWADAATIIPWNVYLHYGDKSILEQQFDSMKGWVDFIIRSDEQSGSRRLWTTGFHFGDWLALDGSDPSSSMGGTDIDFIASAFYRHSSLLVAKAAQILGKSELVEYYERISDEVKAEIEDEFFSKNGRLTINTQTAFTIALYMDLFPDAFRTRVVEGLRNRLHMDRKHLKTGFVGTPYLSRVLSENGFSDLAYTLLLNDDYPSWLYAVKLGATTIWERWNSILPDGKINSMGMNSLNHYAYGSIAEWMYRSIAGINPTEDAPGFRRVLLSPQPDLRLKWAKAQIQSAVGLYESEWNISGEGHLSYRFVIPFGATASVKLPDSDIETIRINGQAFGKSVITGIQMGDKSHLELTSGVYEIQYAPTKDYFKRYSSKTPLAELMCNDAVLRNESVMELMKKVLPRRMEHNPDEFLTAIGDASLRSLSGHFQMDTAVLDQLDERLNSLPVG
ncbi:family 78 glycoside hydrolase catalytic domain [Paenibacillus sp. LHD-38]|uniref:alpha-L-rhamnosidase n=1 Tax=Paenibacillus sp. LHD-38 TaxID=3072143 RepID=UPI00280EBAEC|nr:family 78 glycoside hydrolase catalytic domain [Paenibacillus sp. LHD-38]MDQ8735613.1 family 78 glycoside hydrolase catalytic domain [Paenibacillus sp. LHD-38]